MELRQVSCPSFCQFQSFCLILRSFKNSILAKGVPIPTQTDDVPANVEKATNTQEIRHKTVQLQKMPWKSIESLPVLFLTISDANGIFCQPRTINYCQRTTLGWFVAWIGWTNGTWTKFGHNKRFSIWRLIPFDFKWLADTEWRMDPMPTITKLWNSFEFWTN